MPQDDRRAGNLGAARQQENIPGKAKPCQSAHTIPGRRKKSLKLFTAANDKGRAEKAVSCELGDLLESQRQSGKGATPLPLLTQCFLGHLCFRIPLRIRGPVLRHIPVDNLQPASFPVHFLKTH